MMKIKSVALFLIVMFHKCNGLPAVIRIGMIFTDDQKGTATELAFKYAVYSVNENKILLPNTTLVYDIQYVPKDDSFHTVKKACKQIGYGIQAIFGPFDPILGSHIQSITDALDIPHVEARIDLESQGKEFSINLYPTHLDLNQAYGDMIKFLKWKKLAVIYEEDIGLMKLQEIIRSPPTKNLEIYIRQGSPSNYREILKEIKSKEIFSIIVDTLPKHMEKFLRCLLQLQMNDFRYHYIFTTFDIELFDLEDFKYNHVNMTAFRLVDAANPPVEKILKDMEKFQPIGQSILDKPSVIMAEPALMYDSVNVFARGLHSLERSATLSLANISCDREMPWEDGSSLFNYINSVQYTGLTGPIKFSEGKRSNFKLDIMKLRTESLQKVGEWTTETGINITDSRAFFDGAKPNITLKVVTIEEKPYMMTHIDNITGRVHMYGFCVDLLRKIAPMAGFDFDIKIEANGRYGSYNESTGQWDGLVKTIMSQEVPFVMSRSQPNLTGNLRYEGFCVDLLYSISEMGGFDFEIEISEEGVYGVIDMETQEWNGLVKLLIDKRADLAVGSMTINYARESVIDFTKPFLNLGISILFKIPTSQPTRLFSFMNPLAIEIWLYVLAAYILVSFTMFVMARFSPFEWNNPQPCNIEADIVENQFSLNNSFWFITGTLLRQGSGLNPKVPKNFPTRLFSFMNPIAVEIWLYIMAGYVTVSVTIYVVARFSPHEWKCPHPCLHNDNEIVLNDFSLGNSFWFTIGTLMQQGSDLNPKAASTRIVGGIWWFFTLIIISSYTANLAAFLTVERMITPIENAEDLASQSDIEYGTLEGGSTMAFFRDSKIETYQKMWRYMESRRPSVFVPTIEEGVERVLEGNYAFLMESTMLDYTIQRNCNLTQIGGLLNSNSYGIATPIGSPWRDRISLAILELQEKGVIPMLYSKWWRNTGDVCNRDEKSKDSKASALGVENIGGVFVVLLCGLALAIVVAIFEFCYNSRKNAQTDRYDFCPHKEESLSDENGHTNEDKEPQSLCSEMAEELRFAVRCRGSRQRPALKRNCTKCIPNNTYVPTSLDIMQPNGVSPIFVNNDLPASSSASLPMFKSPSPRVVPVSRESSPYHNTWRRRSSTAGTSPTCYTETIPMARFGSLPPPNRFEDATNNCSPLDLTPPPPPPLCNRSPTRRPPIPLPRSPTNSLSSMPYPRSPMSS